MAALPPLGLQQKKLMNIRDTDAPMVRFSKVVSYLVRHSEYVQRDSNGYLDAEHLLTCPDLRGCTSIQEVLDFGNQKKTRYETSTTRDGALLVRAVPDKEPKEKKHLPPASPARVATPLSAKVAEAKAAYEQEQAIARTEHPYGSFNGYLTQYQSARVQQQQAYARTQQAYMQNSAYQAHMQNSAYQAQVASQDYGYAYQGHWYPAQQPAQSTMDPSTPAFTPSKMLAPAAAERFSVTPAVSPSESREPSQMRAEAKEFNPSRLVWADAEDSVEREELPTIEEATEPSVSEDPPKEATPMRALAEEAFALVEEAASLVEPAVSPVASPAAAARPAESPSPVCARDASPVVDRVKKHVMEVPATMFTASPSPLRQREAAEAPEETKGEAAEAPEAPEETKVAAEHAAPREAMKEIQSTRTCACFDAVWSRFFGR